MLTVETALRAYIEAALFTEDELSADTSADVEQFHPDTLAAMRRDVEKFISENAADIAAWPSDRPTTPEQQAGHDFWLTRNGHGCGFWEAEWSDLPGDPGSRLTSAAEKFGEVCLYRGDDGLIHC